jgi:hypothetical protein
MSAGDHLNPQQFFHGTTETFDHVLPNDVHGKNEGFGTVHPQSSAAHAYATTDPNQAFVYAMHTQGKWGGIAKVWKVEPMGDYEPDVQSPNSYRSRAGWRVTGRHEF